MELEQINDEIAALHNDVIAILFEESNKDLGLLSEMVNGYAQANKENKK